MSDSIIDVMSRDLGISQFANETSSSFRARIIYSGISTWIRAGMVGKSFSDMQDDSNSLGIDIIHLISRIAPTATAMLEILSDNLEWFGKGDVEQLGRSCVSKILRYMKMCGEIASIKGRRLIAPPERFAKIQELVVHLGGALPVDINQKIIFAGIGRWSQNMTGNTSLYKELRIVDIPSAQWIEKLIEVAPWKNEKISEQSFIFKVGAGSRHKDAWMPLSNTHSLNKISLIKSSLGKYILVKNKNGMIQTCPLDSWYAQTGEIERVQ